MGYMTRHTTHLNLGAARFLFTKGTDIFNFIGLVAWQGDLQQKTEPRRSITFEMQDGSLFEVMAWCRLAVICAVVWMIEMTVRLILKSAAAAIVSADLIVNPLYYGFLEYDGAGDSTLLSKKNWNTKKM